MKLLLCVLCLMSAAAVRGQMELLRLDSLAHGALLQNNWDSMSIYANQGRVFEHTDSTEARIWSARWDYYEATRLINKEREFEPATALLETILQRQKNVSTAEEYYAQSLRQMGVAYYYLGELEQTALYWKQALDIFKKHSGKNEMNHRSALNNLGLVYYGMQRYEEAEALYTETYAAAQRLGDTSSIFYAQTLNNLANLYLATGDVNTAELLYKEALLLRKQLAGGKKELGYLRLLNNLAILYAQTRRQDLAIQTYKEAIGIQKADPLLTSGEYAAILDNLGAAYYNKNEFALALPLQQEAFTLRKKDLGEAHPDVWVSMINIGGTLAGLERYEEGFSLLQTAVQERERHFGERSEPTIAATNALAGAYVSAKELEQARAYAALAMLRNTGIVLAAEINKDWANSIEKAAYISVEELQETLGSLYAIEIQQKRPQQARIIADLQFALLDIQRGKIQGSPKNKESIGYLSNDLALRALSDLPLSEAEAFAFIERAKATLLLEAAAASKAQKMGNLPDSLSERERSMQKRQANLEAAISEASNPQLIDSLRRQLVNLNLEAKAFQKQVAQDFPQYARLKHNTKSVSSKEIQQILGEGRAFLNFFVADMTLWVVYLDSEGSKMQSLDFELGYLDAKIDSLHGLLSGYALLREQPEQAYRQYVSLAYWFYQNLLERLLKDKPQIKQLFISADRNLANLPFETFLTELPPADAMGNYADLAYLLRDYSISYQYSAAIWALSKEMQKREHNGQSLFIAASYELPTDARAAPFRSPSHSLSRRALSPLNSAREEAEFLAKTFKGELRTDQAASERRFKQEASEYAIIHLAMHGLLDKNAPHLSCLAFSEDNDTIENNFLQAYEISKMQLRAELVVLSACETGKGQAEIGNGTASLARAFLYAGVPALVVSLWEVNDGTTAILMQLFYDNLYSGMDKATALQQAKIQFLSQAKGSAAHPAFWSAFVQVGDENPISIRKNNWAKGWFIGAGALILSLAALAIWLRRRRQVA